MNLILVEQTECEPDVDGSFIVTFPQKDRRSIHIRTILKLASHDSAKVGIIGGNMYDAELLIDSGNCYKLVLRESNIRTYSSSVDEDISLILAFPRPKGLNRMFPVFSQQGVKSIRVCNAARVEKSYWGSHIVEPTYYKDALLKGLEQACISTRLPSLTFEPSPLESFMKQADLDYPRDRFIRLLCHPHNSQPLTQALLDISCKRKSQGLGCQVVIAIGPEGGWLDFEIDLLTKRYDFTSVSFSPRILSTDVAVVSVVALVSDVLRQ